MDHVRLGNLGLHHHATHVCQRQNVGRLLRGDHCLALQGGDLNHITVHRRFDTGIGKIDLGGIQAGLIFGDLRSGGCHLRLFHRQIGG
ncbi:hypothetical protein D3C71_1620570 [compost metagenome]